MARDTIKRIGYDNTEYGIDYKGLRRAGRLRQSKSNDIAQGVDHAERRPPEHRRRRPGPDVRLRLRRTDTLMPAPIYYAHRLVERQAAAAQGRRLPFCARRQEPGDHALRRRQAAQRIDTVVLSTQHSPDQSDRHQMKASAKRSSRNHRPCCPPSGCRTHQYLINPPAALWSAALQGDCGLTGRKIIVDTYGGRRHGGGAFSGKDPTKVDRSAAYAARYVARTRRRRPGAPVPGSRWPTPSAWPADEHHRLYRRHGGVIRTSRSPSWCEHFDLRPAASSKCSTCCAPFTPKPPPAARLTAKGEFTWGAQLFNRFTVRTPGRAWARRCKWPSGVVVGAGQRPPGPQPQENPAGVGKSGAR